MRRVTVRVPGSCGELIQGIYRDAPCLVSCPVDLYTRARVEERPADHFLPDKAVRIMDRFFERYGLPREEKHRINIALSSEIPTGKGMASSTADLVAVATGLAAYYDLRVTPSDIAELCVAIEPTDNIMFRDLNLFNYIKGGVIRDFRRAMSAKILAVDFGGSVATVGFRGQRYVYDAVDRAAFAQIVADFETGLAAADLHQMGAACIESARLNQKVLFKPYLETMIALSRRYGGCGVAIGHSGTVVGVIYDAADFDYRGFMTAWINRVPQKDYEGIYLKNMIPGGYRIEQTGDALYL